MSIRNSPYYSGGQTFKNTWENSVKYTMISKYHDIDTKEITLNLDNHN